MRLNDIRIDHITLGHLKNEASGTVNLKPWKAVFVLQKVWQVNEAGGYQLSVREKMSVAVFLQDIQKQAKIRRVAAYTGAAALFIGTISSVVAIIWRKRHKKF